MHILGQLLAYAFGRCNLYNGRFSQSLDGAELPQEKILSILAHTWAIVEDAFADAFFHQELVISIRETVGFVANSLEQTQSAGILRQTKRERTTRPVNFLEFFRQPEDRQIVQTKSL
jgi:hypothetical protein